MPFRHPVVVNQPGRVAATSASCANESFGAPFSPRSCASLIVRASAA
jgi:hypothetical protein